VPKPSIQTRSRSSEPPPFACLPPHRRILAESKAKLLQPILPGLPDSRLIFSSHGAAHLHARRLPLPIPLADPDPPARRVRSPPLPAPPRRGMAPAADTAGAARRGDRDGVAAAPREPLGRRAGGGAAGGLWGPVEAAGESAPKGDRTFFFPPFPSKIAIWLGEYPGYGSDGGWWCN
jgi:hypothetical protein